MCEDIAFRDAAAFASAADFGRIDFLFRGHSLDCGRKDVGVGGPWSGRFRGRPGFVRRRRFSLGRRGGVVVDQGDHLADFYFLAFVYFRFEYAGFFGHSGNVAYCTGYLNRLPPLCKLHEFLSRQLAKHPVASKAIEQHDLRNRVVGWKSQFFGSSWANYHQAKPGAFRLVPPAERLPALKRDYQAMRDMYLTEPVSFDEVITTLADLENRINIAAGG